MASVGNSIPQDSSLPERVTRVETQVASILQHFATKADLERQTRLLVMWMIATQIAVVGLLLAVMGNWISSIG